jgi:hypothetical protein
MRGPHSALQMVVRGRSGMACRSRRHSRARSSTPSRTPSSTTRRWRSAAPRPCTWPEVQNADELHDALLTSGFLTEDEGSAGRAAEAWLGYWRELVEARRAVRLPPADGRKPLWVAAERLAELEQLADPGSREASAREASARELFRGRLGILGPVTAAALAAEAARGLWGHQPTTRGMTSPYAWIPSGTSCACCPRSSTRRSASGGGRLHSHPGLVSRLQRARGAGRLEDQSSGPRRT